ncbi:MAG: hypothetical protein NTW20_10930 [Rhodobacterales bacterium]|nr:hypothetical protein [Rhodobacterales bacterium]
MTITKGMAHVVPAHDRSTLDGQVTFVIQRPKPAKRLVVLVIDQLSSGFQLGDGSLDPGLRIIGLICGQGLKRCQREIGKVSDNRARMAPTAKVT